MSESSKKTILAGVSESIRSADALALANAIAACLGADVVAAYVHPFGDLEPATGDDGVEHVLRDSVGAHMLELGSPVDADSLRLIGERSAARGLQRAAEEGGVLLIALGASERSPLGRVLLGSTADRLMSGAPCPVAIAPRGYADRSRLIGTLGCAFDGSPESRAALDWAGAMAGRSGGRVRILAVHEPLAPATPTFLGSSRVVQDEADRAYLSRQVEAAVLDLRRADIRVDASLLTGRAVPVLEEQSSEVDVLVTGSRGYGPERAVLLGSVSEALVRRAACPVIVVPRGSDA